MTHDLEQRKDHHLDLVLSENVERQGISSLFEDVHLVHDALPELDVEGLHLATTLLGKTLRAPLLIVGMTGGTERAGAIDRDLAVVAQRHGVALGLGSQRAMHAAPTRAETFSVREVAPDVLLFGNIGAQQIEQLGIPAVEELVKRIGADGIFVHLNPAQELVQPGGDRAFRGCLEAIRRLVDTLGPRVWVKETGCGLSRSVAQRLVAAGVGGLDVSGAGGTSWTRVEQLRASGVQAQLGGALAGWGIPTAAAVAALSDLGVPVVASGGVRSGIDVAKGLALGATLGGMALPYLKAHERGGVDGVDEAVTAVETGLRAALLLTGSPDVATLRRRPRVLTGPLRWLDRHASGRPMKVTRSAPGEIILLGEHSVFFGRMALAASLPFGITMEAEPAAAGGIQLTGVDIPDDSRVSKAAALIGDQLGVMHARVTITSELPPGGGLGSSAAFAVALARSLAALAGEELGFDRLSEIGLQSERIFHGRPSGVDHTVSAREGLIRFWKGPPPRVEPIVAREPLPIIVALTGQSRDTGHHVTSLVARAAESPAEYEPLIERLGTLALDGCGDVETGDLDSLGQRMSEAHGLLARCGVSRDSLDAIVTAARKAGALGAKLTGAGGGGAAIALAPDPEPVLHAIRALGYDARFALIGAT